MQSFIRRKNIENLTKQLAGGTLDEAQRRYAEQKLAEELAAQRAALQASEVESDPGLPSRHRNGGPELPC